MKYTTAFETAEIALREMQARGHRFRPGVEREAALAACDMRKGAVAAMSRVFEAFRVSVNPNWDGSIA